ncbi:MAG: hypothetical protein IAF58_15410 [Leptolyngbya sp.]|nr:hypothetical protein [Candidatus Melainabacteria bacterium]
MPGPEGSPDTVKEKEPVKTHLIPFNDMLIASSMTEADLQAFRKSGSTGTPAEPRKRSYLETAVHPLAEVFTSTDKGADELAGYMRGFVKTVPIFMSGKIALPAMAIAYMSDEAKMGDTTENQLMDAGLGLGKGAILKAAFTYSSARALTPGVTGLQLGMLNRASEGLLSRNNYYDHANNFNFGTGLRRTMEVTLNPGALAIDALTFGANDVLYSKLFNSSRGMVAYKPALTHTISAGTMGFTSGFGYELDRQLREDGKLDFSSLGRKAFLQGTFDAAGGRVGAWQSTRGTRLQPDKPGAMEEARSTPYQRGEIGDARQMALRDGTFIPDRQVKGLHTETWFGRVKTPEGEMVPAVFRPNDGTEGFASRMQSEIASYGMNSLGFRTNTPATVARAAEINGKPYQGYVQEMNGPSLMDYVRTETGTTKGEVPKATAMEMFHGDPALKSSYASSTLYRTVIGEWDNHFANQTVRKTDAAPEVGNIDLGYSFRVPKSTLEFKPLPQAHAAPEAASAAFYKEFAGKPLPESLHKEVSDLNSRYATAEGKQRLQDLGLTPMQVEGVLGRTAWYANNAFFPRQQETFLYVPLAKANRFAKAILNRGAHKSVVD